MIKLRRNALTASLLLAFAAYVAADQTPSAQTGSKQGAASSASVPAERLPDVAELVERLGPSVVNISVTRRMREQVASEAMPGTPDPEKLFEQFRRFGPPSGPRELQPPSQGSGFIVSDDGYVITNAHVVENADEVTVKLTDGREYKAKVIGADSPTDVALLKVDAKGLPEANIGDPSKLRVGEWVIAIGSPFGFNNTVTKGIVSGKGRSLPSGTYTPFIQTDAVVNPGNSGGPLFNLDGDVVGVNSQIYSRTGGYMGLSFAIPIDIAMNVSDQLRTEGKVTRGLLGVRIQELTPDLAQSFGLEKTAGALVASVDAKGAAAAAGIEVGDVIVKFDGKAVQRSADLPPIVATTKPGSTVNLQVWRKGKIRDVKATLGELAGERIAQVDSPAKANPNRLGLVLDDLSSAEKSRLSLDHGVKVEAASGAAAGAGVQPDDVILAVNDNQVKNVAQFETLLKQAPQGKSVALLVQRGENSLYIPVKPSV